MTATKDFNNYPLRDLSFSYPNQNTPYPLASDVILRNTAFVGLNQIKRVGNVTGSKSHDVYRLSGTLSLPVSQFNGTLHVEYLKGNQRTVEDWHLKAIGTNDVQIQLSVVLIEAFNRSLVNDLSYTFGQPTFSIAIGNPLDWTILADYAAGYIDDYFDIASYVLDVVKNGILDAR